MPSGAGSSLAGPALHVLVRADQPVREVETGSYNVVTFDFVRGDVDGDARTLVHVSTVSCTWLELRRREGLIWLRGADECGEVRQAA